MKTNTQSIELPIEISGVAGMTLKLSVSARKEMLPLLDQVGIGTEELPNRIKTLLQDAVDACDGVVPGLIVSNREW
jgi:hypothetical protein